MTSFSTYFTHLNYWGSAPKWLGFLFGLFLVTTGICQPFISTWNTKFSGQSNSTSITIPTTGTGYNYDVDWNNDGVFDEFGITGSITHDFGTAGTYSIGIKGDFPRIYFNAQGDLGKIVSIDNWGSIKWSSMENAFYGCGNLTISAQDAPDLSNVSSMAGMFREARVSIPAIGKWDVSKVTDMSELFRYATSFNDDLGTWDVSNVTNMSNMFRDASAFNQNLSNWNVSKVTNMEELFGRAKAFNGAIDNWDVSNVTVFSTMFSNTQAFNQPIGKWDLSNATEMHYMFWNATSFNQDISAWKFPKVTSLSYLFSGAKSFNQNISNWDVSNILLMDKTFENSAFNQNLGKWNVSNAYTLAEMLSNSKLSVANYDSTLIGWDQQGSTKKFLGIVSPLKYCKGATARLSLISKGWIIQGDSRSCLVATTNLSESDLDVYPNPTTGLIFFKGLNTGRVIITDAFGKMLKEKSINTPSLDISDLPAGVYFLQVSQEGKWLTKKIVKQ